MYRFLQYNIVLIPVGKLETLNEEHCGSSRVRVLGGQKDPEGGFLALSLSLRS